MTPSPFSAHNPNLQIAWDATSLSALEKCGRYYQYTILEGWRGSNVHLEFGGYFASAVEWYKKARLEGRTKDEATRHSLRQLLRATWVRDRNGVPAEDGVGQDSAAVDSKKHSDRPPGPWGGAYESQWHCCGTEPYRNKAGNRAKCPWSHKGAWFPAPAPDTCGECGSHTETLRRWEPNDTSKNRVSLVRTFLWYCDEQPATKDDGGLQPFAFSDGTPAVELSFALPSPWVNSFGERVILAGHMDALMAFGDEIYITDNKTTTKYLGKSFWDGFSPNVQVDLYDLIGSILYPQLAIKGVVIEGASIQAGGSKFGLGIIHKSEPLRDEFLWETEWWIKQAEIYATADYWPMNRASCFLCPFKGVCSANPQERPRLLEASFTKRQWNPLQTR